MTITLAKAGYIVSASMRGTTGKNETVANELSTLDNLEAAETDITSDESVRTAFETIQSKYSTVDVLIDSAAVSGYGLLDAYSIDHIRRTFEVNFLRGYPNV